MWQIHESFLARQFSPRRETTTCWKTLSRIRHDKENILKERWKRVTIHSQKEEEERWQRRVEKDIYLSTALLIVLCWWVTTTYEAIFPGFPRASSPFKWTERMRSSTTVDAIGSNPAVGSSYKRTCPERSEQVQNWKLVNLVYWANRFMFHHTSRFFMNYATQL